MKIKEKIGLIGVGNMGTAVLEGLFKKKIASPGQVWVYDRIPSKTATFKKKWGVRSSRSVEELLKTADAVILAVKPQDLQTVIQCFKRVRQSLVLVSILAGTRTEKIKRFVGRRVKVVRAMPNLGAKVGEAVTALNGKDARAVRLTEKIFSGCGSTLRLPEKHFDLVTAISGSGPAYFFLMMELLAGYGMTRGLSKKNAELLAVQTAIGSGLLARSSAIAPAKLRVMVTSKKGTTEAALKVMNKRKLPKIIYTAIRAAEKRGRELSKA